MPTVNPTAGDIHVNRPLTNFGQKFLQSQTMFQAFRAMPNLPVSKQSDLYWKFDRGDFYRDEAKERADNTEAATGGFKVSTDNYFAKVYAFASDISDRQRANQDEGINLERSKTEFVTHKLLIKREVDFTSAFFNTGIWTTDRAGVTSSPSGSQFIKWSQAASDPISDVRTGVRTVHGTTGYRPNKMLIGREAYDTLLDNDAILDRIQGGSTTGNPANVNRQLIAALFELDDIIVMDSVKNSAVKGAADSIGFIGGDNALLYYAPNSISQEEPTAGVQFSWTGFMGSTNSGMRIKRYRLAEEREADRVEGQMAYDYKVVAPDLGYFFSDVS